MTQPRSQSQGNGSGNEVGDDVPMQRYRNDELLMQITRNRSVGLQNRREKEDKQINLNK